MDRLAGSVRTEMTLSIAGQENDLGSFVHQEQPSKEYDEQRLVIFTPNSSNSPEFKKKWPAKAVPGS